MVKLRPETHGDLPFLRLLYASTRKEEMDRLPWSDAQKTAFLDTQFDLQHRHYQSHYPEAEFLIVLLGGKPVGRIYQYRGGHSFHLIDITLAPECRGLGIGGRLLADVLVEARRQGKSVRVHLEAGNRAINLCRRLGFERVGDNGIHQMLEWRPTWENSQAGRFAE